MQSDAGFLGWVAGFGGDVIIAGPDSVRAAYREYLQKQLELYNNLNALTIRTADDNQENFSLLLAVFSELM